MKGVIEPYLNFKGTTRAALDFYATVFETEKPQYLTVSDLPEPDKTEMQNYTSNMDMIMNSTININGFNLMASDVNDEMTQDADEFVEGNNITLSWSGENDEDVKKVWQQFVDAGSTISMPLSPTFWASLYGILKDPYGIHWMIQSYIRPDET
ncbi:MAG: glyoxalase/bleomycin resistance/extradiol dioxygenase family protein [Clostridiaceae bacterium]